MKDQSSIGDTGAGQRALRVLVLEHDPQDFELIRQEIESRGLNAHCRRVTTESDFQRDVPVADVIVADTRLQGWNILRALEIYRATGRDLPFIVVSGTMSEESAVECLRGRASDYLMKDRLGRLVPAIERALAEGEERRSTEKLSLKLLTAGPDERKTVARELHDQVGQNVALLLLELNRLAGKVAADSPARQRLENVIRLAFEHEAQLRDANRRLRPSLLDDLGLTAALNWEAREVLRRSGLRVSITLDDNCRYFSKRIQQAIYGIAREALRHAAASGPQECRLGIRSTGRAAAIEVEVIGNRLKLKDKASPVRELVDRSGGILRVYCDTRKISRMSVRLPYDIHAEGPIDSAWATAETA